MQVASPIQYSYPSGIFQHPALLRHSISSSLSQNAANVHNENILSTEEAINLISEVYEIDSNSVDTVIDKILLHQDQETAFFVANLAQVYQQHIQWRRLLPRVEPFYAVKCNPDPVVLKLLSALGTGFDCASKSEIQSILDLGVDPSRIIYANPCKAASYIRYAEKSDVRMMTFDNANELYKIKQLFPRAQLVLRILTDDSKSLCKLGLKFGASLDNTVELLQLAHNLDLNVIGVSFHVGSGCYDENSFADAISRARIVFNQAKSIGFSPYILDVGGGFGHDNFVAISRVLSDAIDKHFSDPHIRIIAEPGRYYVSRAFTLTTNIIAKRQVQNDNNEPSYMYYVNDGVYGAFNCILFDHQVVYPRIVQSEEIIISNSYESSIWGPTCDSIDCIREKCMLPELQVGNWIAWDDMGAYTSCAASRFNGMETSGVLYTWY